MRMGEHWGKDYTMLHETLHSRIWAQYVGTDLRYPPSLFVIKRKEFRDSMCVTYHGALVSPHLFTHSTTPVVLTAQL